MHQSLDSHNTQMVDRQEETDSLVSADYHFLVSPAVVQNIFGLCTVQVHEQYLCIVLGIAAMSVHPSQDGQRLWPLWHWPILTINPSVRVLTHKIIVIICFPKVNLCKSAKLLMTLHDFHHSLTSQLLFLIYRHDPVLVLEENGIAIHWVDMQVSSRSSIGQSREVLPPFLLQVYSVTCSSIDGTNGTNKLSMSVFVSVNWLRLFTKNYYVYCQHHCDISS